MMATAETTTTAPRALRDAPLVVRALSVVLLALGLVALLQSLGWRGAAFPGFFLMPNRVIPSAGLPGWSGVEEGRTPFQHVLLAVDGTPVASAGQGYRLAARRPVGAPVTYELASPAGVETRTFPLRRLSADEHVAIFGMYLLTGAAYLALAALAGARWREGEPYRGLAMFAWAGAAFAFTGMDLYGPGSLFRLHVLAEACVAATATHLALVCPRDRLATRPGLLPLVYGLALAGLYEIFLHQPGAYTAIHNFTQGLAAVPVLVLTVGVALAVGQPLPAVRPGCAPLLLVSALAGMVIPGLVLGFSSLTGGSVPVNVSGWTGFLFPLGCVVAFGLVPRWGGSPVASAA